MTDEDLLEKFNSKLMESKEQDSEDKKKEDIEIQEPKEETKEKEKIEGNDGKLEELNEMVAKDSDELPKENMNYISRNQKEISDQLEFIGKNEIKITNKFYIFKNYKN